MPSHVIRWILKLSIAAVLTAGFVMTSVTLSPAAEAAAQPTTGHWIWPLSGSIRVLRDFEPPSGPYAPGHRGVDLATTVGQQVRAAASGVISFAGDIGGTPMVTITHGALRTTYQPVLASVHVGEPVVIGEAIGAITIAPTHCGLLPSCLHWGLLRGSTYLDPLSLVGAAHVRLLPHLQLGAPTSGVQTLALGPGSGASAVGPSAARSLTTAATNTSTPDSPNHGHTLLASVGVASGAALALRVNARRRRRL